MRFKKTLGLLAIGSAVYYAQKKRGADMSLNGIKNSVRGFLDNLRSGTSPSRADIGSRDTSNLASSPTVDEYGSGYSQGSYGTSGTMGTGSTPSSSSSGSFRDNTNTRKP